MEIRIKKAENNKKEIIVDVEAEELKKYIEKAAKEISLEKKIPGFRPGKVPFEIIKEQVGYTGIWQKACEIFIQENLQKILKDSKLEPVVPPQVEILSAIPDKVLGFKVEVISKPKVLELDYKKIKVNTKETEEVDEKEIEKVLKDLQFQRRKEIAVKRQARLGDKVQADIEMSFLNVPLENGQIRNTTFILDKGYFVPGFSENLVGLNPGEEKKFSLKYPEDFHDKKLAGKNVDFKVKINNIFEIQLPDLDDEFAKNFNFKNLDELKEKIKESIKEQKRVQIQRQIEEEIVQQLLKNAKIEVIPETLIQREIEKMIFELKQAVEEKGFPTPEGNILTSFEDYLKAINKTVDDLRKGFRQKAEQRIKVALIFQQIAEKEKIKASKEEINKEIENISLYYKDKPEVIEQAKSESSRKILERLIISRKVMEFLKSRV